jgi:GDSL-like Lipase/Acylhydrolase family
MEVDYSSRKLILFRAGLVFIAVFLILLPELGARLAGYTGESPIRIKKRPVIGWEMIPDQCASTYGFRVTINEFGFRDEKGWRQYRKDTRPILVMGDSIAFGVGESSDFTISATLQKMVASRNIDLPVLNCGVSNYNTRQEYFLALDLISKKNPSRIVLIYCINDFQPTSPLPREEMNLSVRQNAPGQEKPFSFRSLLEDHLALFWFLKWKSFPLRVRKSPALQKSLKEVPEPFATMIGTGRRDPVSSMFRESLHYLQLLESACRDRGVAFTIVLMPYSYEVYNESKDFALVNDIISEELNKRGLPFINLLNRLREEDRGFKTVLFRDSAHLSKMGNKVVCDELLKRLFPQ